MKDKKERGRKERKERKGRRKEGKRKEERKRNGEKEKGWRGFYGEQCTFHRKTHIFSKMELPTRTHHPESPFRKLERSLL